MAAHLTHLELRTHRGKPCGVIRSSFRADGKVKHTAHGRIKGVPLNTLRLIQDAFRGDVILKDDPALSLLNSREYGASHALLALAEKIGLFRAIYSRRQPWVRDCLAMIFAPYVGSSYRNIKPLASTVENDKNFDNSHQQTHADSKRTACVKTVRQGKS